jgi:hypothetical protein
MPQWNSPLSPFAHRLEQLKGKFGSVSKISLCEKLEFGDNFSMSEDHIIK